MKWKQEIKDIGHQYYQNGEGKKKNQIFSSMNAFHIDIAAANPSLIIQYSEPTTKTNFPTKPISSSPQINRYSVVLYLKSSTKREKRTRLSIQI